MSPAHPKSKCWRRFVLGLLVSTVYIGILAGPASADQLDDETRRIAKQLQCPICESVSVADSTSELAAQMRSVIRNKLENGESEQQIIAYFVERYGEGVRTEPSRSGFSMFVWLAPIVALVAGLGALIYVLRAWLPRPSRWRTADLRSRGFDGITTVVSRNGVAPTGKARSSSEHLDRARRELERYGSPE
jgi:cytochrome c-type biogenesis protein CcmH/NrfF